MSKVPAMYIPRPLNKTVGDVAAINAQEAFSSKKAGARYSHRPYPCDLSRGGGGGSYKKAHTPGGPEGS